MSLRSLLTMSLLAGIVGLSCGGPAVCREVRFSAQAEQDFIELSATMPSQWAPPCAFDSGLEITDVFVDMLPGVRPQTRMTFVVTRSGSTAFTFSQTTAEVPFSAIPQGTHRLRVQSGSALAEGFAGPSGTGSNIAYLRWRDDPFTFELSAVLSTWQTENSIVRLVRGMMDGVTQKLAAETPVN